ncbi:MAG: hypothetical protein QM528_00645 [Phycisphaerales bacterium]|nr:hypothetical protein [Phycisphaerales bacterium]
MIKFIISIFSSISLLLICSVPGLSQEDNNLYGNLSPKEIKKEKRRLQIERWRELESEGTIVFEKYNLFHLKLNTDGYSFGFEHGKAKKVSLDNIYWFEFGERKSFKEQKLTPIIPYDETYTLVTLGKPFVYGKINNFYYLKFGYGQQRLIGKKNNKSGVGVTGIYGGGLSLAFLKPYYLDVQDPNTGQYERIAYDGTDESLFLNASAILGYAGFGTGFNQIRVVPGAFTRLGFRFDFGRFNDVVTAVEVGINAEIYTSKIAILAKQTPKIFFFNSYLAFDIGGRK